MTRVFIGGSRAVARLPAEVRKRLDKIIGGGLTVLVGDAAGADKAVQRYLHDRGYTEVVVFVAGTTARNNVGGWPIRRVDPAGARKGTRAFFATKDRAMTDEATVGLMLWDGESEGTLANVLRLLQQRKKVVVYRTDEKRFAELRDLRDWAAMSIPTELRGAVEESERPEPRSLF